MTRCLMNLGVEAVERGLVPDRLTRRAIRRLCDERLQIEGARYRGDADFPDDTFARSLQSGSIALGTDKANEQHYELPSEFFEAVLGPRRKYSCCYWPAEATSLADAEEAALRITCERAQLADGQDILELGCGWGSLTLWMAERYPHSRITAVSNSRSQRDFILAEAKRRGAVNLHVVTADMNGFDPKNAGALRAFDRVVSVEMFEHMRNYEELLGRIATWLKDDGKLFVHIFCHRQLNYPFETEGSSDWMGKYFFTGGMMPSFNLLRQFDRDLRVTRDWMWNGIHYQKTADAWLDNLDRQYDDVLPILVRTYGAKDARRWFHRWRMFFLAVSELFGYSSGEEWFVAHYLMEKPRRK